MSNASVQVIYDGAALEGGLMEVSDLAPALIGIAEACQRANELLNGVSATLSVQVRADMRRGSFHVELQLAVLTFAALLPGSIASAADIAEKLFTGAKSVFHLLELFEGKKPEIVNEAHGKITFIVPGNNNKITVNSDTYNLSQDSGILRGLGKGVRPVYKPGIDKVEIGDKNAFATATKKELPYFSEPTGIIEDSNPAQIAETERVTVLAVLSFATQENQKSRFTDGATQLWAVIEDPDFWRRYHNREYGYRDGDRFQVLLALRQDIGSTVLKGEYVIRKVLKVIEPPEQTTLKLEGS